MLDAPRVTVGVAGDSSAGGRREGQDVGPLHRAPAVPHAAAAGGVRSAATATRALLQLRARAAPRPAARR